LIVAAPFKRSFIQAPPLLFRTGHCHARFGLR
jgi:hypothetical protein